MAYRFVKAALLTLVSTVLTTVTIVCGYEIVLNRQYDRWRAEYEITGDWLEGLTIASPNETLMWEYRPDAEYVHPTYHTATSTNEFGFRQLKNVSIAKPGNVRRIAFVGDSVTLGREVAFNRIFSEIFRGIVDAGLSSPQIESLNFGIDGYNTPQIAELLFTSVFQFSPDVVIYSLCLNDFDFEEASGNKIKFFNKPKSFFLRALTGALKRVIANDYHSYYYQKNKHVVFRTISEMHRQTLQRGAEFYVVILPVFKGDRIGRTGRVYRYELASFEKYPLPDMHREITWALKNRDIRVFDLLPNFVRSGRPPSYFAEDVWHMNENGHEFVARAIARAISESGPKSEAN